MNRTEKAQIVDAFAKRVGGAPFIVVTEFRGTKVSEINALRRALEKNGMGFRVIKNTLARRAFAGTGIAGLDGKLKGMTGVLTSGADGIGSARVLRDLLKTYPTIKVRAGYFDGAPLDANAVKSVADLPGREEILGRLLGCLQASPRQVVTVLSAPARDLLQVLTNREHQLAASAA